ncbi:MAG: amidohydrolase family protein [Acidobacteria bacterium]|nr:amidohydrolase family protein [Acidobacteriota bacterium]
MVALLAALPALAADNSFLLRGATVHTVSGAEIAGGSVLVAGGKIAELGVKVVAPKGVRVIDVKGLHVYPGLIDSGTQMGLSEVGSVRETADANEIGDFNPQLRALIAINPASEHIPVARANGITTVVSTPGGGVLSGQAALVHLDGWTWEEMEVRRSAAMVLNFPTIQTGGGRSGGEGPQGRTRTPYPESKRIYDKKLADLREFFESARRYRQAKLAGPAGFRPDVKFETMIPVLEGKLPVAMVAVRERAIREALQFAEKQKIRIMLCEPREAGKLISEIKAQNVPVILGPTQTAPLNEDDPYDAPYTLPAQLHQAGIRFAFGTFSNSFSRNLPYNAAHAVAYGLPYQEGLKAITLNAAEIWGVADQYGSIDKGKWADLMVTDGDPLEVRTQVRQLFIHGREISLDNKHLRLYQQYNKRP